MSQTLDCDVLVIGAGASGIPAAIAAAREGASVILLDEDQYPGGTAVDQYVSMPDGGPRSGIVCEMLHRLESRFPLTDRAVDKWWYFWYLPGDILRVVSDMIAAEPNIRLICPALASRLTLEDRDGRPRVTGAIVPTEFLGELRIRAKQTIESTGVGALSERAGCEARYGEDSRADFGESIAPEQRTQTVQECTWMYVSQKIPGMAKDDWMPRGLESGYSTPSEAELPVAKARGAGIYLHWGCRVQCRDTRDPIALAEAQREGLTQMAPKLDELRERGWAVHLAPKIGVRETRRIMGEAVVTANDMFAGHIPDDSVLITQRPIDIWRKGVAHMAYPEVKPYGIPYRSLIPKGYDGLMVVGKSMSGTHLAMASYRVQCLLAQVGQAAGVAAAMAARTGTQPRQLDFADIKPILLGPGQNMDLSHDVPRISGQAGMGPVRPGPMRQPG